MNRNWDSTSGHLLWVKKKLRIYAGTWTAAVRDLKRQSGRSGTKRSEDEIWMDLKEWS